MKTHNHHSIHLSGAPGVLHLLRQKRCSLCAYVVNSYKLTCCLLLITSFIVISGFRVNDPVASDLKKISQAYAGCKYMHLEATTTSLAWNGTAKPVSRPQSFTYMLSAQGLYYKMNQSERITNKQYSLIVDHQDKTIILDRNTQPVNIQTMKNAIQQQDYTKLAEACSAITPMASETNHRAWKFTYKEGQWESIELTYNTQTWTVKKMVIHYRGSNQESHPNTSEVEYKLTDLTTPLPDSRFSLDAFVTIDKSGKTAKLTNAYQTYQFINHLN